MLRPASRVQGSTAYTVPRHPAPIELDLRGNEGAEPDPTLIEALRDPELLRLYPDARPLEASLAAKYGLAPEQVIVTAGGDDALDRICRASLEPGRTLILPAPGFEMTARYARLAGGEVLSVPWPGAEFPTDAVLAAIDTRTGLVAVTSPNNPTGAVISDVDLRRISEAALTVGAMVLVDLAYAEFAEQDHTALALSLNNTVVVRTFSKAWGLAGLRVGWAAGPPQLIAWLRAAGAPYAVAAPSLALAARALQTGEAAALAFAQSVRDTRAQIGEALSQGGLEVLPSQANFAFARGARVPWLAQGLAGLGIGVRVFPDREELRDAVRVACPPDAPSLRRLIHGVHAVLRPQALLFDMDGVLADVSGSYRAAIVGAAAAFGVSVSREDITALKDRGNANNDWVLTQELLVQRGVQVPLEQVTQAFEDLYQGKDEVPGLWTTERLLGSQELLSRLARRLPLAVVTGRPRRDAQRFLHFFGLEGFFSAVVCMEDGPLKPDPFPVREALRRLGLERAWMLGDTPDDLRAARAAGVVPIGVCAPGDHHPERLLQAGASRVLSDLFELEELL